MILITSDFPGARVGNVKFGSCSGIFASNPPRFTPAKGIPIDFSAANFAACSFFEVYFFSGLSPRTESLYLPRYDFSGSEYFSNPSVPIALSPIK